MERTVSLLKSTCLVLLGLALFTSAPVFAQEAKSPKKISTIEGITQYELDNGVRLLLFPDPTASTVTVNMTVLVGSRHEGYGETGMAHLLEHMLFKGSKNFPDADKALIAHGAGRSMNGTTWVDRTNYYETMPASDDNLEFGIKFEADRLVNCFIRREDLAKEMTVVRNEFERGENSEFNVLNQRMMAVAFEWHNYGKSTIGNRSDIERVPIENLQAFYRKFYQPDNVVLTLTGKFDQKKALAYVSKYFGAIPRPDRQLSNTYTEEPAQDGERTVLLRRIGKVSLVGVMYHIPAVAHPDNAVADVTNLILGEAPAGRLYKALVETKKATSVSVGSTNWHDPGVLEVYAQVADGVKPEEVRDIIIDQLENFKPATKEEVARAIKSYLSYRERSLANSKRVGLELSEWIGAGDWRMLFLHRDRVAKTTPKEIDDFAERYFRQSNRTVGIFFPSKTVARTPIPEGPKVASLIKDYKGGKAVAQGEVFDPTPANIEARVKRITLQGGLKVALLAKKTRNEKVVGQLALHFGNEKSLNGLQTACDVLGPLMKRGTEKYTRQEIVDKLAKLSSSLNASSDTGQLAFSWQSKRDNLPAVLEILEQVLRHPTFPQKEFEEIQSKNKQSVEKSMTDPQALCFSQLTRTLHPYPKTDIRYRPTLEERLQQWTSVSREEVVDLYKNQVGGQAGEFVLVGDFDADAALEQIKTIFAGWKAKVPYERIASSAITTVKGAKENILTPDKEGATYAAGLTFPLSNDNKDYAALVLGNHLLGGDFSSRLMDKLRQKDGLCYGTASIMRSSSLDPYSLFVVYAICNPINMDKVDAGAMNEVAKILKAGISEKELLAGKKAYLQNQVVQRGNDDNIADMLQSTLHLGRTFDYYANLEKSIAALSTKDVNEAMRRHIDSGRFVIIRAGDFNKKAPAPIK